MLRTTVKEVFKNPELYADKEDIEAFEITENPYFAQRYMENMMFPE